MSDAASIDKPKGGEGKLAAIVVLFVVALALVVTAKVILRSGALEPKPLSNPEQFSSMVVPTFELVDQDGEPVNNDILLGQYTVMEFMFSNCQLVCPIMKSNLIPAANALKNTSVRFVSISVDPQHDTPEHLREYAKKLGIDTSQWSLLTGDVDTVREIASSMGFAPPTSDGKATNLIDLGNGQTMENIIHPSRFIVLDPEGRVVGLYGGTIPTEAEQMVADLRAVMRK